MSNAVWLLTPLKPSGHNFKAASESGRWVPIDGTLGELAKALEVDEQAKVDVKDEFILMEIVEKENISVTQEDMVRRITHIAYTAQSTPDKVIKTLKKNDGLNNLRHSILLGKALDVLVEHATVNYEGTASIDEPAAEA